MPTKLAQFSGVPVLNVKLNDADNVYDVLKNMLQYWQLLKLSILNALWIK